MDTVLILKHEIWPLMLQCPPKIFRFNPACYATQHFFVFIFNLHLFIFLVYHILSAGSQIDSIKKNTRSYITYRRFSAKFLNDFLLLSKCRSPTLLWNLSKWSLVLLSNDAAAKLWEYIFLMLRFVFSIDNKSFSTYCVTCYIILSF